VSEFLLLPDEVYAIAHLGATTVWRLERDNRFPRRIKIASRKVAWRKADVLEWARDPVEWCRNAASGRVRQANMESEQRG
jgi:predicted DNA-binding transcriptional regulator AlpA